MLLCFLGFGSGKIECIEAQKVIIKSNINRKLKTPSSF
jgi:hypothetical protein